MLKVAQLLSWEQGVGSEVGIASIVAATLASMVAAAIVAFTPAGYGRLGVRCACWFLVLAS